VQEFCASYWCKKRLSIGLCVLERCMTPQVFISYSSKDKAIADAICLHLESADIACWMAPRNIDYGSDWTEGIMKGITACRVFVLVFSENANGSGHVRREVAKASSLELAVIPFRIEEVQPSSSLCYFLETLHWLDAVTPPLDKHFSALTTRVKKLLANGVGEHDDLASVGLRPVGYKSLEEGSKRRSRVFLVGACVVAAVILVSVWWYVAQRSDGGRGTAGALATVSAKSVAVLPFESISASKDDGYFADGVQDEILNNLAKIAHLKVISRTSVMQYRADTKRDMRQIAYALGVANVVEGTVRRDGNRVRVSAQLVDARSDNAVWADSYDRDLTDIFAIQSEVAQTIAGKLSAAISPEEVQRIQAKPTDNMEAYDLYLRAKEKIGDAEILVSGDPEQPLRDALNLLKEALRLDARFAVAYSLEAYVHDALYLRFDPSAARLAQADAAINNALRLQPDLPEIRLAYANHLYRGYRDYERARAQLAIAKQHAPNSSEALYLEALMDRRQGQFERAVQLFDEAIKLDPRNPLAISDLAETLSFTRQFSVAEGVWDRIIKLVPDPTIVRLQKESLNTFQKTGDDSAYRSLYELLTAPLKNDKLALSGYLNIALDHRNWAEAKDLIQKMKGDEDAAQFAYATRAVPVECYSILIARLQGEQASTRADFAETRELLSRRVAPAWESGLLLSNLAVVDALMGRKDEAIDEAKRAVEMIPVFKDALEGPRVAMNLAVVYAWTDEPDLAFEQLEPLAKIPYGLYYSDLKLRPYFEPLRGSPRFEKLLTALSPHD
jgi:TolB-like protein/Tfp pilus assembly protein PilF